MYVNIFITNLHESSYLNRESRESSLIFQEDLRRLAGLEVYFSEEELDYA